MRGLAITFGGLGVGCLTAAYVIAGVARIDGGPVAKFGTLMFDFDPLSKLAALVLLGILISSLVICLPRLMRRSPARDADLLRVFGFLAPGLGLAAATKTALNIYLATQRLGPVRFEVMAPSVAGSILIAGLGLLVGGLSAGLKAATDAGPAAV